MAKKQVEEVEDALIGSNLEDNLNLIYPILHELETERKVEKIEPEHGFYVKVERKPQNVLVVMAKGVSHSMIPDTPQPEKR